MIRRMSHLPPPHAWAMIASLFAGMTGAATAIFAGLLSTRRGAAYDPRLNPPQGPMALLVAAVLLGVMGLAFVYQGVSERFPPSFLGAAVVLAGAVFAVWLAMRRRET
jgi:drug/metabolite transporter (DMT)-like permease